MLGIIERACCKTVVREIPGITACYSRKETIKSEDKDANTDVIKVAELALLPAAINLF